jgi:NDP-sugar pyrophosphorylase family protein
MEARELFLPPPLGSHFPAESPPWTWLAAIGAAIRHFAGGDGYLRRENVWIHRTATVDASAHIEGTAIIGPGCRVRRNALLRGAVILSANCTVGHGCEVKSSLLLDGCTVPHLNYVGDSVLGAGSHIGAGVILSNLRLDCRKVRVHTPNGSFETGLVKCGSFLGDGVQIGCNAVLQPGTVVGRGAVICPTVAIGGYIPPKYVAAPGNPVLRPMEVR